jgi:two-component system, NtrC family, response regulator AtoC
MPQAVLIIEDEATLAKNMQTYLTRHGYEAAVAGTGEAGLAQLDTFRPDCVLLDYQLPRMSGLEVLARLHAQDRQLKVIVITGQGSVDVAVKAMKAGAFDYLPKPLALSEMHRLIEKALGEEQRDGTLAYYQRRESAASGIAKLVGTSPPMLALQATLRQLIAAEARLTEGDPPAVLISGETGTGKELVARALHYDGPRRAHPFLEVNCAAIPAPLLESELWGHERGAFTDAKERKPGLVEAAHRGSLFLDEIGEIDAATQVKLLKLLEEKQVRRLGGLREQHVDVRIIAATNQDLEGMVRDGTFRADLFFRLRIFHLHLPPLRERGADILLLAQAILAQQGARYGKPGLRFSPAAEAALLQYRWPGNVRELRNTLEQTILLAPGAVIEAEQLALCRTLAPAPPAAPPAEPPGLRLPDAGLHLATVERTLVAQALDKTQGNVSRAARLLGLSRDTLRYRLEKYTGKAPALGPLPEGGQDTSGNSVPRSAVRPE